MVSSMVLCKNCYCTIAKFGKHYRAGISRFHSFNILYSSYSDDLIENLVLEEGIKQESNLTKYFKTISSQKSFNKTLSKILRKNKSLWDSKQQYDVKELVYCIEKETGTNIIPNEELKFLLVYFSKEGNINGVKAIQFIVEKHNAAYFKSQANYNHYLAEASWISGKMHTSINLFSVAYDNMVIRPKVKVMLPNLFPSLTAEHSSAALCRVIRDIEQLSAQKRDYLILACLWRELFLSTWYSDQEQALELLKNNKGLIKIIQWMVPSMGKNLLKSHREEDFYRLIQFTLENELKQMTALLIRLLFDYYYVHQNIERCTAVVKYSTDLNSCLTEDQHRRYISLLLKCKDATSSKSIVKKSQDLKFKF